LSIRTRSGLRESPVTKGGDEKEGRSANNEAFLSEDRELARCKSTEL